MNGRRSSQSALLCRPKFNAYTKVHKPPGNSRGSNCSTPAAPINVGRSRSGTRSSARLRHASRSCHSAFRNDKSQPGMAAGPRQPSGNGRHEHQDEHYSFPPTRVRCQLLRVRYQRADRLAPARRTGRVNGRCWPRRAGGIVKWRKLGQAMLPPAQPERIGELLEFNDTLRRPFEMRTGQEVP